MSTEFIHFGSFKSKIKSLPFFDPVARRGGAVKVLNGAFSDLKDTAGDNQ